MPYSAAVGEIRKRQPTGAAVLQADVTEAITEAVLDELADTGYGKLSMEAVARRAGVGKSALYRRWPSKQEMVMAVVADFSIDRAAAPDTGSLRGDLAGLVHAFTEWLTHPRISRILPDLAAEGVRNAELAEAVRAAIGGPRRTIGAAVLQRAIARGELPADTDLELALDLIAAPVYWRLSVRGAPVEPGYLDAVADAVLRALTGRMAP
ncbi:TetR/AcrR family transcriptional regulator [Pseudonocardia zijingensis]|uniref:TetR/AcrR family transcriptional regulator n=1 Tax=Pseudonocardia zijingensis TaxID=153376 RepID=A0ABP3YSM0_9PSEU